MGGAGGESPARIPRMVGADGEDSWELGWGWNVAGHCLPSDQAGGVQVQPKKKEISSLKEIFLFKGVLLFKEGDFKKISIFNPQAFNSDSPCKANIPIKLWCCIKPGIEISGPAGRIGTNLWILLVLAAPSTLHFLNSTGA